MGYVQLPCHETFLKFVSRWKNTFSPPFFQDKSTAQGLNRWMTENYQLNNLHMCQLSSKYK